MNKYIENKAFQSKIQNMKKTLKSKILEIDGDAQRQYIDAKAVFTALESANKSLDEVRGGMIWRSMGNIDYLVRTSAGSGQKGLGPRSEQTESIYKNFTERKERAKTRVNELREALIRHQRMNKALHVGRAPDLLVEILNRLAKSGISDYFTVIGTHALYAYESAAGARFMNPAAMTTRDVDLLWDVRRSLRFVTQMESLGTSFLGLLRKVDPSFEIRDDQHYTAVNNDGFEIDIIRRERTGDDPHPIRLTDNEDEFFAVEARRAGVLLDGVKFSAIIVSGTGRMARMNTISPVVFTNFKRWMAAQADRDPIKRRRDLLQAELVEELTREYFPNI